MKTIAKLLTCAVLAAICIPSLAQSSLTNGLVAYYTFEGNANDQSGNGNNASTGGNSAFATGGLAGNALKLTGDNSLYYAGGGHALLPGFSSALNGGFTISTWIKPQSVGGSPFYEEALISFGIIDLPRTEILLNALTATPALRFIIHGGNPNPVVEISKSVTWPNLSNAWHHVVMTYAPGKMSAFLDGQKIGETNVTYNVFPVTKAGIGRHWWDSGSSSSARLNGMIDNVRVYSRALSDAEVSDLNRAETITGLSGGLVAFYPFNGNANDESGNGRHGTVQGATLSTDRFGRPSNAYRFDDVDDGIRIGNSPVTGPLTISAWILKEGDSTTHDQIVCVASSGGAYLNIFPNTNPSLKNHIDFGANYNALDRYFSPNAIPTNVWLHVLATYDGQRMKLYQNGQMVLDVARTGGFASGIMCIGRDGGDSSPSDVFRGGIDDVRIYNRALSSNEVAQLYSLEYGPTINLIKAVKPSLNSLIIGTTYQLQLSSNLTTWTNHGAPFTATDNAMVYPQYWDVDNWDKLFFRVQVAP